MPRRRKAARFASAITTVTLLLEYATPCRASATARTKRKELNATDAKPDITVILARVGRATRSVPRGVF